MSMPNSSSQYQRENRVNEILDDATSQQQNEQQNDEGMNFISKLNLIKDSNRKTYFIVPILGSLFLITVMGFITMSVLYEKKVHEVCEGSPGLPQPQTNREMVGDFLEYSKGLKDKYCGVDRCNHRGECAVIDFYPDISDNRTHVDYRYGCKCIPNTWGDQCGSSVCDDSTICHNFTCVVGASMQPDNYACKCPKGYSGNKCEEDPCSSHPCQNGGTCSITDLPNDVGFTHFCQCPLQYIGATCSEHRCDDFKCVYGACIMDGSTPRCQCLHGYEGADCSLKSCDCANGDCHRDMEGKPNCKCYTGFMGDKCSYRLPNDHSLSCRVDSTKQVVCTTTNNANNLMWSIYTLMLSVFIALKLL